MTNSALYRICGVKILFLLTSNLWSLLIALPSYQFYKYEKSAAMVSLSYLLSSLTAPISSSTCSLYLVASANVPFRDYST